LGRVGQVAVKRPAVRSAAGVCLWDRVGWGVVDAGLGCRGWAFRGDWAGVDAAQLVAGTRSWTALRRAAFGRNPDARFTMSD